MHVEATRLLTRWLKDSENGVNALLLTIPRDKLPSGADPRPKPVDIYNDVDFDILITSGLVPPSMPSLVVVSDINEDTTDIAKVHAPGHLMTGSAGIGFYAEQSNVNLDVVAGNYVMRAVKQSLTRFNRAPKPLRTLNKVLIAVKRIEMQRVASAVPESHMLGVVFADLIVLDEAP